MYDKIHSDYSILDPAQWVSLDCAFTQQRVDFNSDGLHPGEDSNQHYYQMVADYFKNTNVVPNDKYSKGTTSHGKNQ